MNAYAVKIQGRVFDEARKRLVPVGSPRWFNATGVDRDAGELHALNQAHISGVPRPLAVALHRVGGGR